MHVKNATVFNEAIKRSAKEGKAVFSLINGQKHETLKFRTKKGELQAQIQSGSWISVDTVVVEEREQKPEHIQKVTHVVQKELDLRNFKKWLRENKDKPVGYVGSQVQVHPLLRYAQEYNIYLPSILKSRWGNRFRKLCIEKGIPGEITGYECQCLLADVIGYHKAFA